jgi:hypothetical protein
MKLIKINKVTTDAIVDNTAFYINAQTVVKIVTGATTCVVTFVDGTDADTTGTVTFTVDGADTAEKLLNAQRISDYFGKAMMQLEQGLQKGVFDLIPTIADFHSETGIVHTGGTANTALVTTALA